MASNYTILSVGGSIIIPKTGFDISFLKKFKKMIEDRVKAGEKFILVIGGGATCRQYQHAASQINKMSKDDLDWLGIASTVYNAEFVRFMFKEIAFQEVVRDPKHKVRTSKSVIIAAGEKPGQSTDSAATTLAKTYGAKHILNLSNIAYVYDRDPNKFSDAQKIEQIDWKTFRKEIVGSVWEPGKNVPFDPTASKIAEKSGMTVSILEGTNLAEVKKALEGKKFKGTQIHP